jgi:hypothetical protein
VGDKIVVPVSINGAGPFDFLVDTGDTDTIIDRKQPKNYICFLREDDSYDESGRCGHNLVDTDSLSMRGAIVRGLKLVVVNHFANILPNVRGSLGEISCKISTFLSTTSAISSIESSRDHSRTC